ncbi:sporulation membrane protein YtaF (plasmid) [Bacillus sp. JAS24-2]|uniref:manganese efflux pump n=1 Tax=Bacillus sp. JAS24-2 TaxID=2217832 RepID=UPI0011EBBFB4|nr:manganese efflux pump [Bacillus sp. JAS24-2]QEL82855.1 sporulation membrane protein YtaF [Bacillus sp. JAS24-2]
MSTAGIFSIILIGISSNLDNAGVAIAYGMRKIQISWFHNLIIACFGFLFTLLGGIFGNWISLFISEFTANLIGAIVLGGIGILVLCQSLLSKDDQFHQKTEDGKRKILHQPEYNVLNSSKIIGLSETMILGIALSINNIAGGFDAGITNLNLWWTAFVSGIFSLMCMSIFSEIGKTFLAEYLGKWASVISSILLILIGMNQIL